MIDPNKTRIVVGVSDLKISKDPGSFLVTYSLGSCVGVVAHDPVARVGGILHFQLHSSREHAQRAKEKPCMFADLGIPLLLEGVETAGAHPERTQIRIYGGASILRDNDLFKIGIQNTRIAKKILWQRCRRIVAEDVGGNRSRTVRLDIGTGEVEIGLTENTIRAG